MEYRLRDLPDLLRVPVGRRRLRSGFVTGLRPLLTALARPYRRWVVAGVPVVAITGSYGKSTTTRAVCAALGLPPPQNDSNTGSTLPLRVLRMRPGRGVQVQEVSVSRRGQGALHAGILRPETTVVTCVGTEHNLSMGTLDRTRLEKGKLVAALPADGLAVLNGDDPNVIAMAADTRAPVVTFGFGDDNDVRAGDVALEWPRGLRLRVHTPEGARDVRTRLLGRHQLYSVLAAVAVARHYGRSLDQAVAALAELPPMPGRLDASEIAGGAILLRDDAKSSLETVHAALDLLAELPTDRRLIVLGDISEPPGSQGPIYREIGARLAETVTYAAFVSNKSQAYRTGARRAGMPDDRMVSIGEDPLEAAAWVRARLTPGSVVLVKGRVSQRLERVSLALSGVGVACRIPRCTIGVDYCVDCPMLARGWEGYPRIA